MENEYGHRAIVVRKTRLLRAGAIALAVASIVASSIAIDPSSAEAATWTCTSSMPTTDYKFVKPFKSTTAGSYMIESKSFEANDCSYHSGFDEDLKSDNTTNFTLRSPGAGDIKASAFDSCMGNFVVVRNWYDDTVYFAFAHMKKRSVSTGDPIGINGVIGTAGGSGSCAMSGGVEQLHVHISATENWKGWNSTTKMFNGLKFLDSHGVNWTAAEKDKE